MCFGGAPFEVTCDVGLGAAYGTAKSGTGIAAMSVMRPELIMKSIIPVVMAGIIAIYGLVVAVLVGNGGMYVVRTYLRMFEIKLFLCTVVSKSADLDGLFK